MKNPKNIDFFADNLLTVLEKTPSLTAAFVAQDKSAQVGFDFKSIDIVMSKVQEECREVQAAFDEREKDLPHFHEEIGDCFFVLVNLCRHAHVDPEMLLRDNTRKYLLRCKFIEDRLRAEGKQWSDMTLDQIYAAWKDAKKSGL